MIDFLRRELVELNGEIYEIGSLFEVAHIVEHHSRNGAHLEAHRVVNQFSQEVGDRNLEQYFPLVELLHKGINELQESQKVLEAVTQ